MASSICLWCCAMWLQYILQQKCLNQWIGSTSTPQEHNFTTFSPLHRPYPSNSHLLKHRHWCHVATTLKPHYEQANRQKFHIWNSHRVHAARLFQRMPFDRLLLNMSSASCFSFQLWGPLQCMWINMLMRLKQFWNISGVVSAVFFSIRFTCGRRLKLNFLVSVVETAQWTEIV